MWSRSSFNLSGVSPIGTTLEPSRATVVPSAPGNRPNMLSKVWFSLEIQITCLTFPQPKAMQFPGAASDEAGCGTYLTSSITPPPSTATAATSSI